MCCCKATSPEKRGAIVASHPFWRRQNGIFELAMTYTEAGDVLLKERGQPVRPIDLAEASRRLATVRR